MTLCDQVILTLHTIAEKAQVTMYHLSLYPVSSISSIYKGYANGGHIQAFSRIESGMYVGLERSTESKLIRRQSMCEKCIHTHRLTIKGQIQIIIGSVNRDG